MVSLGAEVHKIVGIDYEMDINGCWLQLEHEGYVLASHRMLGQYVPDIGDYLVVLPNGYRYLCPNGNIEPKALETEGR